MQFLAIATYKNVIYSGGPNGPIFFVVVIFLLNRIENNSFMESLNNLFFLERLLDHSLGDDDSDDR